MRENQKRIPKSERLIEMNILLQNSFNKYSILLTIITVLFGGCSKTIPVIVTEYSVKSKAIKGKCSTMFIDGGWRYIKANDHGIILLDKKFKFSKNIRALRLHYLRQMGECYSCSLPGFNQIEILPTKVGWNLKGKDSVQIVEINENVISYRTSYDSSLKYLKIGDSIMSHICMLDTIRKFGTDNYDDTTIILMDYVYKLKFSSLLDLRTLKFK
jgi:hypothetical protein